MRRMKARDFIGHATGLHLPAIYICQVLVVFQQGIKLSLSRVDLNFTDLDAGIKKQKKNVAQLSSYNSCLLQILGDPVPYRELTALDNTRWFHLDTFL